MIFAWELKRKKSRNRPPPNLARNQCLWFSPRVSPWRNLGSVGSTGMSSRMSFTIAARTLAFAPCRYCFGSFAFSRSTASMSLTNWSRKRGWTKIVHPFTTSAGSDFDVAFDRLIELDRNVLGQCARTLNQVGRKPGETFGMRTPVARDEIKKSADHGIVPVHIRLLDDGAVALDDISKPITRPHAQRLPHA